MLEYLEILIGTYEEFLLGYIVKEQEGKTILKQSFADKSHSASIRCLAVHDHWVATGAADDRIFVYDMSNRKQSQILLYHEGTVNALCFTPDGTHLLSGASDGCMIATFTKTWCMDVKWNKPHSTLAVTQLACHPSGKLALTLGADLVLCTWNLIKGRIAYKTNLKIRDNLRKQPDCLTWSPNGAYFTLTGPRIIEVLSIKAADVIFTQATTSKPICLCWISDDSYLVGLEDGNILWQTVSAKNEEAIETKAHNARVKTMHALDNYLVTASSSGEIKLWQIYKEGKNLKQLAAVQTGCRPTCISIINTKNFGPNHNSKLKEEDKIKQDIKPVMDKGLSPPRGVVTIEFENDQDHLKPSTQ